MSVDLSISIVNFNTMRYLGPLLESIREQEYTVDGHPGVTEVILVDNASRGEDSWTLQEFAEADERVRVIQNTCNTGYAQANNQAFHVAKGTYHMVLNPDTLLLPGCLQALVGHLEENPGTAMVGPLSFMDRECTAYMPPNELPTPELFGRQARAQVDRDVAIENLRNRTRLTYDYWSAEEPLEMEMLSGSCVTFRRSLYDGATPFDPGFPLYYEDTDMFVRLGREGHRMMHVPAARMIHFFSRSAMTHSKGAEYRSRLSEERYFEKHFGDEGLAAYRESFDLIQKTREGGAHIDPFEFESMEVGAKPPEFYPDAKFANYYAEIAGNPIFTLAVAIFPEREGYFTVSRSLWEELGPNTYWFRIVDRATLETLQAWVVSKVTA